MEGTVLNGDIILLNGLGKCDEERRIVCHNGRYFSLDEKSGHTLAIDKKGDGCASPKAVAETYENLGYKVSLKKEKKKGPAVASGSIEVPCLKYEEIKPLKNEKSVADKKKTGITQQGQMTFIELGNCKPSGIISDDGYNDSKQLTCFINPPKVTKEAVPMITAKHAKILKEKLEKYGANGVDELQVYAQLVKIVDFYERTPIYKTPEKTPTMYFGQDWSKGQDATMTAIQDTINGTQKIINPETIFKAPFKVEKIVSHEKCEPMESESEAAPFSSTEKAAMGKFREATEAKLIEDIAKLIAAINHVYTPFENVNAPSWHGMRKDQKEYLHRLVWNYMKDGISFQKSYERDVEEAGNPLGAPYNELPKHKRAMDAIAEAVCDFFK